MPIAPPRWAPGLPLPAEPYQQGPGRPRPTLPLTQALAADGATHAGFSATLFGYGVDLFHAECFWEAHECWEELWRRAERGSAERALLQGLILLAAARVKHRQGRPQGADALQRRALAQLERAHEAGAHSAGGQLGVDVARLLADARAAGVTGLPAVVRSANR